MANVRCPADLRRMPFEGYLSDPHGTLREARAHDWIASTDTGTPMVLAHADLRALLGDERFHSNVARSLEHWGVSSGPFYDWMSISPLNHDGPYHKRWRSIMFRTFTPRSVERLRPFLAEAAHGLIDGFAAAGSCDFVSAFADPYPSLGLCELIGVPAEDRERFREWSNVIGLGFNLMTLASRITEIDAALTQLLAYTSDLVSRRRREPRDDLVTRIVQAGDEESASGEEPYTGDNIAGFVAGLVFAGHETTRNQLGWLVHELSGKPAVWDAVGRGAQDPEPVVEEVLRLRGAVGVIARVAGEEAVHRDVRFNPGDIVLMSLWSANHDDAAFPASETFDPAAHGGAAHAAFGYGPHHCLGAALARAELQEALRALTTRIGCPALAGDVVWKPPFGITGPDALPIRFAAR